MSGVTAAAMSKVMSKALTIRGDVVGVVASIVEGVVVVCITGGVDGRQRHCRGCRRG
jgi:hypothetical protein